MVLTWAQVFQKRCKLLAQSSIITDYLNQNYKVVLYMEIICTEIVNMRNTFQ